MTPVDTGTADPLALALADLDAAGTGSAVIALVLACTEDLDANVFFPSIQIFELSIRTITPGFAGRQVLHVQQWNATGGAGTALVPVTGLDLIASILIA